MRGGAGGEERDCFQIRALPSGELPHRTRFRRGNFAGRRVTDARIPAGQASPTTLGAKIPQRTRVRCGNSGGRKRAGAGILEIINTFNSIFIATQMYPDPKRVEKLTFSPALSHGIVRLLSVWLSE